MATVLGEEVGTSAPGPESSSYQSCFLVVNKLHAYVLFHEREPGSKHMNTQLPSEASLRSFKGTTACTGCTLGVTDKASVPGVGHTAALV